MRRASDIFSGAAHAAASIFNSVCRRVDGVVIRLLEEELEGELEELAGCPGRPHASGESTGSHWPPGSSGSSGKAAGQSRKPGAGAAVSVTTATGAAVGCPECPGDNGGRAGYSVPPMSERESRQV